MGIDLIPGFGAFTPGGFSFGSATNYLTNTQSFDNAAWTKAAGATITANDAVAPDGTTTADKTTGTSTDFEGGYVQQGPFSPGSGTQNRTWSVYIKAGTATWVALSIYDTQHNRAWFNISSGSVGTVDGTISATAITASENGYYRLSITKSVADGQNIYVNYMIVSADNAVTNATVTLWAWGAQLENSSSPTAYNNASP